MQRIVSRRQALAATAAAGLAAAGWLGRASHAVAGTPLLLSSWAPPGHPLVNGALIPWCEDVFRETEGRVAIRIAPQPLASPAQHFDLARQGGADITYGLAGATAGARHRFPLARLAELSFLGDDAAALSEAFWRQYDKRLRLANQFTGVHILSVFCHGPGTLHLAARPIRGPADLRGLSVRVPGGYITDLMVRVGARPIRAPAEEAYEMLAHGGVDAVAFPMEALLSYRLAGFIRQSLTVPGGLYNSAWFLAMNERRWAGLAGADREIIARLSGAALARRVGEAWNAADAAAVRQLTASGVPIEEVPRPVLNALAAAAAGLEAAWVAEAARYGVDGAAALRELRTATGVHVPV